jgi:hypothetical protein
MFNIGLNKLRAAINKVNLQGDLINSKIGKFIQEDDPYQRSLELCQVGKFLSLFDDQKIEIIEKFESPDFILSVYDKRIGLEHCLILNEKNVKQVQSLTNIFKLAENEFENNYPRIKLLANCWISTDYLIFKQKHKKQLIKQIVDYIYGMTQKSSITKPDFLDDVMLSKHSGVSFSPNYNISNIEVLDSSTILKAIHKKESLVDWYIEKSGLHEQWLLLVAGQISPDSYRIEDLVFTLNESKFERIYLLDDYKSIIYKIK